MRGDAKFERVVAQVHRFVEAPRNGLDLCRWMSAATVPASRLAGAAQDSRRRTVSYAAIADRIGARRRCAQWPERGAANTVAVVHPRVHRVIKR